MTHYTCPRCGAQMAPWDVHSDGDDDVCPECCTSPACNGPSVTDQLVDHLAGITLTPTAHGTNVRRRTDPHTGDGFFSAFPTPRSTT